MSAPRRILLLRLALFTALACLGLPAPCHGLDYDRNDVRARELGIITMIAPIADQPFGMAVYGSARRHRRFLYMGTELQLGALVNGHPWVSAGGIVGVETADDAWARVRGYAEAGTALIFAYTKITDVLGFFGEVGVRYQLRALERPHLQITGGLRGLTNFSHGGVAAQIGLAWTFD